MKIILILLSILFFLNLPAQNSISGIILDSITKKPIPFVMISVKGENRGTYSTENGNFNLNGTSINDSILVTHLSYKPQTFSISNFKNNSQIALSPKAIKLNEIIIKGKKH